MAAGDAQAAPNCRDPELLTWEAASDSLVAEMVFPAGGEWFSGHFPDFPVLPGVAQLFYLRRYARRVFPDFPDAGLYRRIKFRRLVRPNERVRVEVVRKGTRVYSFTMSVDGSIVSSGKVEGSEA